MSKKVMLLVASKENSPLYKLFAENFRPNGISVVLKKGRRGVSSKRGIPKCPSKRFFCAPFFGTMIKDNLPSLIIIEVSKDWIKEIEDIEGIDNYNPCIIVASKDLLRQNIEKIKEISKTLFQGQKSSTSNRYQIQKDNDLSIEEFVEKKLRTFVKKMKDCKGHNIYSMLIKEFETPLITFILKETNGNKTQAAQLLGINRNTLSKKIKELNISIG